MRQKNNERLRLRAEERLAEQKSQIDFMDQANLVRTAHDLAIHRTELEIQNEELRQSRINAEQDRDRYIDLYNFAPVGYLTVDENNRIVEANLTASHILMITRALLLKTTFIKFISADENQRFHFYRIKVMGNTNRQTIELKMQKADGTPFDAQLISIRTGQERFRVALVDITERRNTERELIEYKEHLEELVLKRTSELHRSEQNFRSSIENSPLGIRIVSASGVTLYANQSLLNIYGYDTLEELESIPASKRYSRESYAEHLERKEKRKQAMLLLGDYEICIIRKDRHRRYLRVHRSEVLWDGRVEFQCIYDDVTKQREAQEKLKALSKRLLEVQEDERRSMALELHDEIGQSLNVLKLLLGRQIKLADGELKSELVNLSVLTSEILDQVRQVSLDLRPGMLDDLGLLPALIWYFNRYTTRTGIKVNFKHSGLDRMFSQHINGQVYRVVQEALNNVSRHTEVKSVDVQARVNDDILRIKIKDKGRGFDIASKAVSNSVGLEGMRERVRLLEGSLTIDSAPGHGTRLALQIPLQSNTRKKRRM